MSDPTPDPEDVQPGVRRHEVDVVDLPEDAPSRRLFAVLLGGPVLWALHFVAVYLYGEAWCVAGGHDDVVLGLAEVDAVIALATVVATAGTAAVGLVAWRRWRGAGSELALAGLVLAGMSAFAILLLAASAMVLDPPC